VISERRQINVVTTTPNLPAVREKMKLIRPAAACSQGSDPVCRALLMVGVAMGFELSESQIEVIDSVWGVILDGPDCPNLNVLVIPNAVLG